VPEI
jgi:hypothetical protein